MRELIISICKRDPDGPITSTAKYKMSIAEYPWTGPKQELPKVMRGSRLFNISIPESYLEIYDKLPTFMINGQPIGFRTMLHGMQLDMAFNHIVDAISNIHTYWKDAWIGKSKDWTEPTPDMARKALEELLELIHLCIDTFPNEWRKTYAWAGDDNDKLGAFEIYIQNSLI